jgi:hypothetical protein
MYTLVTLFLLVLETPKLSVGITKTDNFPYFHIIIRLFIKVLVIVIVVLPCILISSKLFCRQMHSLLKHKMLQRTLKISLYMASTCFCPFGPSSGTIRRNLAKVTVFVEIISKNASLKLLLCCDNMCCVYWVLCGVSRRTLQTEAHIATEQHNFNDVFILINSTKAVTLARFRRMLPDGGPNGPKHVGAM